MESNAKYVQETKRTAIVAAKVSEIPGMNPTYISVELFAEVDGVAYRVYGYSTGANPNSKKLADRLAKAWEARAIGGRLAMLTDVHGKPYVSVTGTMPLGRHLNADLKKVGF